MATGAGSGIGRAIAQKLARDGAAVAIWDINQQSAEETQRLVNADGGRAIAVAWTAPSRRTSPPASELGPITILMNNAGITGTVPSSICRSTTWIAMEYAAQNVTVNMVPPASSIRRCCVHRPSMWTPTRPRCR
ncbi:SDR family NAD(P)-dependent oxidoreductase [Novosphingobium sp. RD2P27]|uniref:SDR family NAD(P)-dependent oxidoreductase n=1 Tax=Novosphingobium kalidii TaxID=3230299 RepID=A0ABV2D3L6_9SPHN